MKTCIINLAKNAYYPQAQKRLKESFLSHGYTGDFLFANEESEWGAPSHKDIPYAFKSYGFQKAISMGYDRVIWCDSVIHLYNEHSLSRIYDQLDKTGNMIALNAWSTGSWCSDDALKIFGITRDEAFQIPHPMANVLGFDLNFPDSVEFLRQYHMYAQNGAFKGAWTNKNNEVSLDHRVLGHRHDQTAAGVIAWRLGMTLLDDWTSYDPKNIRPMFVFLTSMP